MAIFTASGAVSRITSLPGAACTAAPVGCPAGVAVTTWAWARDGTSVSTRARPVAVAAAARRALTHDVNRTFDRSSSSE